MMTKKNITTNGPESKPINGSEKVLNHVQKSLVHNLKPLMIIYFKKIDVLLLDMAERADSNKKQKAYFESMKTIKVHKLNVLSSFLSSIKHTFDSFKENNFNYFDAKIIRAIKKKKSITESIDKNDIDEKLTQNCLIQRAESLYREDIKCFQKHFSMLNSIQLDSYHIPISPYVLVSSFAKSIRLLHLDLDIKLVLYNQFESIVLSNIGQIYKEISHYLNDNKIIIEIENQALITAPPVTTNSKHQTATSEQVEEESLEKAIIESTLEEDEDEDLQHIFDNDRFLEISTAFQKQIVSGLSQKPPVEMSPIKIKNTLYQYIDEDIPKFSDIHISQPLKDAINLITMMFQLVSGDRNIPKSIKTILSKLHIPYIKAAIIDNKFLTNKQHPAQVILTAISKSSIGWTEKKDTNKQFIDKVELIIETVLNSNYLDENFFETLLDTYQGSIANQRNKFKKEQNRVKNKLKGRDRIVSAMKTVEAIISHKLADKKVPPFLTSIIQGPWKNLLVLMLVRHTDTSKEYLDKVNFIDELLANLHAKKDEISRRKSIETLSKKYEEGLRLVAYNGDGLHTKVTELNHFLLSKHGYPIEIIENKKETFSEKKVAQITENDVNTQIYSQVSMRDLKPIATEEKTFDDSFLTNLNEVEKKIIQNCTIGTWFEFQRYKKNPVKAQLSWISPKTGMFLFVNSRGLKVVDKMPNEIIEGLSDSSISMLKKH